MNDDISKYKPWGIKVMSVEIAAEITAEARRQSMTTGQFVERLYREWKADGSPVVVAHASPPPPDLVALADVVLKVSQASGKPYPARSAASLYALMAQRIKTVRAGSTEAANPVAPARLRAVPKS